MSCFVPSTTEQACSTPTASCIVKVAIASALHALVTGRELGEVFSGSTRVTSRFAGLLVVVVLWESFQAGRVRYVPAASGAPDRYSEIEGAKARRTSWSRWSAIARRERTRSASLPSMRAGIPELWVVDTPGGEIQFRIHTKGRRLPRPRA
jgi:hypothetical protein